MPALVLSVWSFQGHKTNMANKSENSSMQFRLQ